MPIPSAEAVRILRENNAAKLYLDAAERLLSAFPDAAELEFVRAPGRVNVIGEHTDYNGLPVLPMAIDREIVIALSSRADTEIALVNVDDSYPEVRFALSSTIAPYKTGHWGNYAKAAAQAIAGWAASHCLDRLPLRGFTGCAVGNVPPSSGLSSSSALVVAAAVALAHVNRLEIGKPELAELLAKGERYVGTEGGGMDQAVSLMAEPESALRIDFFPLRTRSVKLPENHVLVVANSLVQAHKTGGARLAYNTRVAECRLGLEMLRHDAGLAPEDAPLLRDFAARVPDWRSALDRLPDGPLTPSQIAGRVELAEDELSRRCLTQRDGSILPPPPQGFYPKKRCRHVLSEGDRVERAAEASARGDASALGRLMYESHSSCASDYEVSCPELDRLVASLRGLGALGARLTGAGFGGCAVALVPTSDIRRLIDGVWRDYYGGYLSARDIHVSHDRDSVLFACSPAPGAGVREFASARRV